MLREPDAVDGHVCDAVARPCPQWRPWSSATKKSPTMKGCVEYSSASPLIPHHPPLSLCIPPYLSLIAEGEELRAASGAASNKGLVRGKLMRSHCEKCLSPSAAAGTVKNTGCHASPGDSLLSAKNSGLPYGLPQTKCWSVAHSRGLTAKNVSAQARRQARSGTPGATHGQETHR